MLSRCGRILVISIFLLCIVLWTLKLHPADVNITDINYADEMNDLWSTVRVPEPQQEGHQLLREQNYPSLPPAGVVDEEVAPPLRVSEQPPHVVTPLDPSTPEKVPDVVAQSEPSVSEEAPRVVTPLSEAPGLETTPQVVKPLTPAGFPQLELQDNSNL